MRWSHEDLSALQARGVDVHVVALDLLGLAAGTSVALALQRLQETAPVQLMHDGLQLMPFLLLHRHGGTFMQAGVRLKRSLTRSGPLLGHGCQQDATKCHWADHLEVLKVPRGHPLTASALRAYGVCATQQVPPTRGELLRRAVRVAATAAVPDTVLRDVTVTPRGEHAWFSAANPA